MKTVVTRPSAHVAQQITNMEKLAPGFAEPFIDFTGLRDEPDKTTLVLARDHRAFTEWRRYVSRARDLHGCHADNAEIVELPDWRQSIPLGELREVESALAMLAMARPPLTATTAAPPGPLDGRNASGRKIPPQSLTSPSISRSSVITVEQCQFAAAGYIGILSRVRIGRTKERKGAIEGDPLDVVTTQYLDGKALRVASTRKYYQEDEVAFDAVPARTKDITDFGRLTTAAKSLAVSMAAFGPDNEPSSEQLAVFINGYRNLLEWRRKVRQQMTQAEGEIDAVETLLTQIL